LASPFSCGLRLARPFKGRLTGFLNMSQDEHLRPGFKEGDRFAIVRLLEPVLGSVIRVNSIVGAPGDPKVGVLH
jgi:hypothetical protein